jgi:hypothetical protein
LSGFFGETYLDSNVFDAKVGTIHGNTFSRVVVQNHVLLLENQNEIGDSTSYGLYLNEHTIGDGSTDNRLIINDEVSQKGLVYSQDYTSNFTTYSLVSKGYADSLLSRVENGLTQSPNGNIMLGGSLNTAVVIEGFTNNVYFSDINRFSVTASNFIDNKVYAASNTSQQFNNGNEYYTRVDDALGTYSQIVLEPSRVDVENLGDDGYLTKFTIYSGGIAIGDQSSNNRFVVTDDSYQKGIVYSGDYTANFTTYSLVTKGYADSLINLGSGLTQSLSGTISLGGLFTSDVNIQADGYSFRLDNLQRLRFTASSWIDQQVISYNNPNLQSRVYSYGNGLELQAGNGGTYSRITVKSDETGIETNDGSGLYVVNYNWVVGDGSNDNKFIIADVQNQKGMIYDGDYTANFTTYSLVTKGYVDSKKPYKVYTALLTQTSTNAPTASVLENTFGITATFSYATPGQYYLHMSGQFTTNTFIINGSPDQGPIGGDFAHFVTNKVSSDIIVLQTLDVNGAGLMDGLLNDTSIEIRVYL